MTKPPFERVEELFHAAVALPADQRAAYLDGACNGDTGLRAAVEDLLHFDDAPTQLDRLLVSPIDHDARRLREPGPRPPKIPGYDILAELGRGGMGVVYKARHLALGRTVALKMLLPGALATASQIERFRAEAATLARLSLPNVVPVYDIGECDGTPFFTMEYIEGPSLAQTLTGHPRDVTASTRLVETLARAMASVHESGIVHRDLKPANILLAGDDTPKITDFGVAKDRTAERDLTGTGLAVGTPRYMAPEQATRDRGPVGPAADIYALGSILYELLIGRTPFDAGSAAETVAQLLTDDPVSPARLRPNLPRDLVTVCMKCLEKTSSKRYATAGELADDLQRFRSGEPIHARAVGPVERAYRWCRRRPLVAGLTALSGALAVAVVAVFVVYNARLQQALADAEDRVVRLNVVIGTSDSEAGDHFAAALRFAEALRWEHDDPEQARTYRARLLEELRRGPSLTRAHSFGGTVVAAVQTPEGWRIATESGSSKIDVWDVVAERRVGEPLAFGQPVATAAFSSDGRWLAVAGRDGSLMAYDLLRGQGESVRRGPVLGRDPPSTTYDLHSKETSSSNAVNRSNVAKLSFHPDAPVLLARYADSTFGLWDMTATGPKAVVWPANGKATVSDDARWVAVTDDTGRAKVWNVAARTEAHDVPSEVGQRIVAADGGHRLAFASGENDLRIWHDAAPGRSPTALRMDRPLRRAVFSPDGSVIVTTDDQAGVRFWNADSGRMLAELPRSPHGIEQVAFGPGGREVVLTDSAGRLRAWDTTTGRPVAPPLHHGGPLAAVAVQAPPPSGGARQLVAVSRSGVVRVWTFDADPSSERMEVDDLVALTQLLSNRKVDENQRETDLEHAHWWAAWNRLRSRRR